MVVKYSTTPVANTIKVNNLVFGSEPVGYGPTSSTGFWNGIDPPTSGYTIYYYTSGMTMPSIVCPNNDTDAIYWAKAFGGTNINTIGDALTYFITNNNTAVFNINHPGIVTDGLLLNLDAGLVSSYPKTGTTWYDLSGYGNNGTLTNGPTFNSENMGSLSFAGANDYVSLSYRPQYDIRTGITISIFMKRTTGYNQLQDFHLLSRYPAWFFYDAYNSGYITGSVYIDGVRKGEVTTGIIPMDGHWYYITYTYDSNTHYSSIYINGILKSNLEITGLVNYLIDSSTNNFQNMGQQSLGRGMLISILSLYNRALSPTEITQNFNAMKSRFGL